MTIERATTEMGNFYYLAEDAFIGGALRRGIAWEQDVVRAVQRLLPKEGPCNVIDVGAHVGTLAVPFARSVAGRGCVYAFEPQAIMAELLARNLELNGCQGVHIFPYAVGHVDGIEVSMERVIRDGPHADEPFQYEDGRPYNYGGLQLGAGGQRVTMRTLDSFHFEHVALLKVDAEGAEPLILWGARDLIRRCRPFILFERNAKTVTESMRSVTPIPDEARLFRVEDFVSALDYGPPTLFGTEQYLLWPE